MLKAIKEFSIQEVGLWVSKTIECIGGEFKGEYFVNRVLKWKILNLPPWQVVSVVDSVFFSSIILFA